MRRLLLVRHGEIHSRWQGCCYGASDVGLSPRGRAQSRQVAEWLAGEGVGALYTSDLGRARYLARELEERIDLPAILCLELRERDFGEWEKRSWEEIYAETGDAMDGMMTAPESWRPPGGETTFELRDRVLAWYHRLAIHAETVVAVTHGGAIAALIGTLRRTSVSRWTELVPAYGEVVEVGLDRRKSDPSLRLRESPRKDEPWIETRPGLLVVHLGRPCRSLSWALVGGGLTTTSTVAWCQVRGPELAPPVDPEEWLHRKLAESSLDGAVAMMTSRRLDRFADHQESEDGVTARVVATLGLSNGVAAGDPATYHEPAGTINIHCHLSVPLSDAALIEAAALVTEAKTAALVEHPMPSSLSGRPVTGTGTDCVVVTCPPADTDHTAAPYAGKHGVAGAMIGSAVRRSVSLAYRQWRQDRRDALLDIPEAS